MTLLTIFPGDQLCGIGLSVRFNAHLITIWHRESSKQKSIDNLLACVLEELPSELQPKSENYFYKKHSDHASFKAPPELQAVLDSQKRVDEARQGKGQSGENSANVPDVVVQSEDKKEAL